MFSHYFTHSGIFFAVITENRIWHFMQIVSIFWWNIKSYYLGKNKKNVCLSSAVFSPESSRKEDHQKPKHAEMYLWSIGRWPRWLSRMCVWLLTRWSQVWVSPGQHTFVERDHEIFSTVILSLLLIQEGQLSVSGIRMFTNTSIQSINWTIVHPGSPR